jgi:NADH-quinone oxidoreductase subunit E
MPLTADTRVQMREIIARYPKPRSALMPMLHLVQAEEGFVTPEGIEMCAEELGLTTAEVTAVVTFYSMYKRKPIGDYHVGVCTNALCAVMGGDTIFKTLKDHLDIENNETTPDGKVTLEHIECNAACDFAPVVMVNWEFFDNQTVETATDLVDRLRAGKPPKPSRGPAALCTWREAARVLAGYPDGRANEGPSAGAATLVGLRIAAERGWRAPDRPSGGDRAPESVEEAAAETRARSGSTSASDAGAPTAPTVGTTPSAGPARPREEGNRQ